MRRCVQLNKKELALESFERGYKFALSEVDKVISRSIDSNPGNYEGMVNTLDNVVYCINFGKESIKKDAQEIVKHFDSQLYNLINEPETSCSYTKQAETFLNTIKNYFNEKDDE